MTAISAIVAKIGINQANADLTIADAQDSSFTASKSSKGISTITGTLAARYKVHLPVLTVALDPPNRIAWDTRSRVLPVTDCNSLFT
ncbi:hypothetical protein R7Q48_23760 [Vibrio sp. 378]|uniref:hypothetical protein n=1 Tax=Vibrio TaxID=662 RepID=UPI002119D21A|nr:MULTISPECIES: hypothetical protein [Vibrio]MCQ9062597.1 hypothetical protein [Vibrio alginolyticus]MDW2149628.1 hypothetical protein [Vibrio sp. 378]